MKKQIHALPARLLAVAAFSTIQPALTLKADTFDVNLNSAGLTLYTDPYNGNQIKVVAVTRAVPGPHPATAFSHPTSPFR